MELANETPRRFFFSPSKGRVGNEGNRARGSTENFAPTSSIFGTRGTDSPANRSSFMSMHSPETLSVQSLLFRREGNPKSQEVTRNREKENENSAVLRKVHYRLFKVTVH